MRRSSKKAAAKSGSGSENKWHRLVFLATDDPAQVEEHMTILNRLTDGTSASELVITQEGITSQVWEKRNGRAQKWQA